VQQGNIVAQAQNWQKQADTNVQFRKKRMLKLVELREKRRRKHEKSNRLLSVLLCTSQQVASMKGSEVIEQLQALKERGVALPKRWSALPIVEKKQLLTSLTPSELN